MTKKKTKDNKPVIETLINTAAIAISAYGVTRITSGNPDGYITIVFAMCLEFSKYWGRNNLWQ